MTFKNVICIREIAHTVKFNSGPRAREMLAHYDHCHVLPLYEMAPKMESQKGAKYFHNVI